MDLVLPVSMVVPVHNEDPEVVRRLIGECRAAYSGIELIVVDDGSVPAQPLATLRHEQQRGYGAAIKTGLAAASQPWVVTMDGDGQHRVEDIERLYDFVTSGRFDLAIGHRRQQPEPLRRAGTQGMNLLARLVTGLSIQDLNCGLRIFRRTLGMRYQDRCCDGFSFTTSIVMAFLAEDHRVGWLPITVKPRTHGGSKVRLLEDGCLTAFHILRLGLRCRAKRTVRAFQKHAP
jgi:glycosyltransferase involved in cell wall biosynthesis